MTADTDGWTSLSRGQLDAAIPETTPEQAEAAARAVARWAVSHHAAPEVVGELLEALGIEALVREVRATAREQGSSGPESHGCSSSGSDRATGSHLVNLTGSDT